MATKNLTKPLALSPNGHVAVLAISSPSSPERIDQGRDYLQRSGLSVSYASNLFSRHRDYLAGPDKTRLAEINLALNSPRFDAFLFSRGGYGAMRILDEIDYAAIARNPRPIIGFSDITALAQAVAIRAGVSTFHGPMVNTDFHGGLSPSMEAWFWSMLRGESGLTHHFAPAQVISPGKISGILFGGCLSLTVALMGTPYDFWIDDGIWFFEEVDEPTYRIDRMLTQLRLSGRLRSIRGVMIGKLKDCGRKAPAELDELLLDFFSRSGIPVVRDLPFGHHGDNLMLPIGARVDLDTPALQFAFPEPAVICGEEERGAS